MVTKTSQLLSAGKNTTTGAKGAMMLAANPKAVTALKSFIKSPAAKVLSKAVPGLGLASLLATVGSVMGKDSKMSQKLKEQRMKIIEDRAKERRAGKPMKNRIKKGPDMRARKSAMSDAQKKAGGSTGRDALREAGRGKAGPKRNAVKGGGGIVKNQSKAVTSGKGTAAYKRMMERRKNR